MPPLTPSIPCTQSPPFVPLSPHSFSPSLLPCSSLTLARPSPPHHQSQRGMVRFLWGTESLLTSNLYLNSHGRASAGQRIVAAASPRNECVVGEAFFSHSSSPLPSPAYCLPLPPLPVYTYLLPPSFSYSLLYLAFPFLFFSHSSPSSPSLTSNLLHPFLPRCCMMLVSFFFLPCLLIT